MFRSRTQVATAEVRVTAGFTPFATVSTSIGLSTRQRSVVEEQDVTWTSFVNTPVLITSEDSYLLGLLPLADLAGHLMQHGELNTYIKADTSQNWLRAAIHTGHGSLAIQLALVGGSRSHTRDVLARNINRYFDEMGRELEDGDPLVDWLPATADKILDVGIPDEARLRRWYKHVMEYSPLAKFPIDGKAKTIRAWDGAQTTPDIPQKLILELRLTDDNAGWKKVLKGEFPVLHLKRGMPQGEHIPRGALWTSSSTLLLLDPCLAKVRVTSGSWLRINGKQLKLQENAVRVGLIGDASIYHYDGRGNVRSPFVPVSSNIREHYFIGGSSGLTN